MRGPLGELVTFSNSKGLNLDGILYQGQGNRLTIVHVHGSYGNFYQNQFLRTMARVYLDSGVNLLSFNLSAHDGIAEGYSDDDEFQYVGGALTQFGDCLFDIQGALRFVDPFSERVVLQGHSLGCDRVLHFLISQDEKFDFVLLAPCDSYQLQTNWIAPETVEQQLERLQTEFGHERLKLLPTREYGLREADWTYEIPVTLQTFVSIAEGPPFKLIRINDPADFYIDARCFAYIGHRDVLQTANTETMFDYFKARVRELEPFPSKKGDHMMEGVDEAVSRKIVKWLNQ